MQERKIEHPLRTIVLKYDEGKPETDYEKDLVKCYVELHDRALVLQQRISKLLYEYGEQETAIAEGRKKLKPIAKNIAALLAEATAITQHREYNESVNELYERMHEYASSVISDVDENVISPLYAENNRLWEAGEELEKEIEAFGEEYQRLCYVDNASLYEESYKYALDPDSYENEMELFLKVIDQLNDSFDKREAMVDVFEIFANEVDKAYGNIEEAKRLMTVFFDEDGLLDRKLSESYATGKGDAAKKPLYLIAPGEKSVADFGRNYGMIAGRDKHTIMLSVESDLVMQGDVEYLQNFVAHLQHYPRLIEKWLWGIKVKFLNRDGIEMPEDDWKGHGPPMKWFHKMSSLPCCIFFLQDADARFYFLAGDLLAANKLGNEREGYVSATGKELDELCQRLFQACWFFMLFCHNTEFDPASAIKKLLEELGLPVTLEQVKAQYEKDIKNGIELKRVKK